MEHISYIFSKSISDILVLWLFRKHDHFLSNSNSSLFYIYPTQLHEGALQCLQLYVSMHATCKN